MTTQNPGSRARTRDLIAVVADAAPRQPDAKVCVLSEEDGSVSELWVQQRSRRRYARLQSVVLTIAQAKSLRAELDAKIADAERRNAVVSQQQRRVVP